jgi:hypothetical protein
MSAVTSGVTSAVTARVTLVWSGLVWSGREERTYRTKNNYLRAREQAA